jgi:hypothetical protein
MYFQAMLWALGLADGTPAPHARRGTVELPPARGAASR